jgi:intracellular sulfur oxidation DsrE/DsrF family protein
MKSIYTSLLIFFLSLSFVHADDNAPWGKGKVNPIDYAPQKVVYDVSVSSVRALEHVLDRASYLSKVYKADPFDGDITLVMHGDEINFFARKNYQKYKELMTRAQSLTVGNIIKFKMCKIAAKGHGYDPEEIHGFVELIPMADAEIVRLQTAEGYAYMR